MLHVFFFVILEYRMDGRNFSTRSTVRSQSLYRVATNLENMEHLKNSGNLKNCQNLREDSGKIEFLWKKPGKLKENEKYVT